ncbi:uncharacterized protein TNCV_1876641 [Trichonephila clavipes]|nr:uncharacterized protein TNCV_1876641 [Trichonephila clavipes]
MARINHLDDFTRRRMIGNLEQGQISLQLKSSETKVSFRGHGKLSKPYVQLLERLGLLDHTSCLWNNNAWPYWTSDTQKLLESEDTIRMDCQEGDTNFFQSIPGFQECDEEDVETWMACDTEDCGFQMLNDDKIVTSVQEESNHVDDETDEDEDNTTNVARVHEMHSALETAMEWYEKQSE